MDMMLEQFKIIFDRPEKVKKLRETILNLAVKGKLLEQDPNDEPASVLLERIREEKEKLVQENKIKREKSIEEIKLEEVPYEIPQNWSWARLIDLGNYKKGPFGSAITKNMFMPKSDNTIKVYEQKNAIKKDVTLGNYYISEEYFNSKLSSFEVFSGDIIVSCAGTIGESYVMPSNAEKGIINQALMKMNIFKGMNIEYFLIYFDYILKNSAKEKSNGSAMKNIPPFAIFKNMVMAIPPLNEQKRIVEKVDSLMAFCDKLEKSLEKKVHYSKLSAKSVFNSIGNATTTEEVEETLRFILSNFKDLSLGDNAVKELKNCILQLAVQGKLVPQDPSDEPVDVLLEKIQEEKERLIKEKKIKKEKPLAEISEEEKPWELPQGCKWIRLGDLTQKIGAGSTPKGGRNVYLDSGIKFIRSQNVYNDRLIINNIAFISEETNNKMSGSIVKAKDILMNITGGSIGRCCIVPDNFDIGNVNQHVSIVRVVNYSIKEFLHIVLTSPYIFNSIMNIQVGISREGLSIAKLANFLIPIPPLAEQKRIVEKVDSLMQLCDELENNIEQSKKNSERLMQSVLQDVFNDKNEENNQLSFGEFIKQKRKDKGVTITNMLELLKDVKSSEYTKIEEGFVKPEQFIIEKIANVLKLSETEVKYFKKLKIKTDMEKCLDSDYEIKIAARRINKN